MKRTTVFSVLIAGLLSAATAGYTARAGGSSPADGVARTVLADPRQAGIRYGQAAGMAAVCENMQATAKAEGLASAFSGPELETFKVQAETIINSWRKTLTCAHANDPTPCRLAHQMSCREAYREIGPNGTIVAGLVEMKPAK